MEETQNQRHHTGCKEASVDVYSVDKNIANKVIKGRAILDVENKKMVFSQNAKRGPQSVEIGRSFHGRLVRRPDGLYTLSFSCVDGKEDKIRFQLISEVRELVKVISADLERRAK